MCINVCVSIYIYVITSTSYPVSSHVMIHDVPGPGEAGTKGERARLVGTPAHS